MRTHYLLTLFIMLLAPFAERELYAQQSKGARILIMVPSVIALDDSSLVEIQSHTSSRPRSYSRFAPEGDTREEIQLMEANRIALARNSSLAVTVSAGLQELLAYVLHETSPRLVVLVDEYGRQGHVDSLRAIARADSADYVVALDSLTLDWKDGHWRATMNLAVYESRTDSLLRQYKGAGGDDNTGDMFSCPEGTIDCALTNCAADLLWNTAMALHGRDPRIMQGVMSRE